MRVKMQKDIRVLPRAALRLSSAVPCRIIFSAITDKIKMSIRISTSAQLSEYVTVFRFSRKTQPVAAAANTASSDVSLAKKAFFDI